MSKLAIVQLAFCAACGGTLGLTGDGAMVDARPSDSRPSDSMMPTGDGGVPLDFTVDGGPIPDGSGWQQLPNTQLQNVCANDPAVHGVVGCAAVIAAWSGGIGDEARARMIVWGGGHDDYYGNELYALNLDGVSMVRLNNPSPPNPTPDLCITALPDGRPNSRHTYNGLAYIAHADKMFVFGGGPAEIPGCLTNDTWTLDLSTLTWTSMDPHNGPTPAPNAGVAAAYDPNTKNVILHDTQSIYSYHYETNTFTLLNPSTALAQTDYHLTAVVDAGQKLFIMMGGGQVRVFDLSGADPAYSMQTWDTLVSGCDSLRNGNYPGLAYHSGLQRVVGWAGGDTVYYFDSTTKTCTPHTYPNGPGAQQPNGTNGRWRYFPSKDLFLIVNDWAQDAFILRL